MFPPHFNLNKERKETSSAFGARCWCCATVLLVSVFRHQAILVDTLFVNTICPSLVKIDEEDEVVPVVAVRQATLHLSQNARTTAQALHTPNLAHQLQVTGKQKDDEEWAF